VNIHLIYTLYNSLYRYEAQKENDWRYIINDSGAKVVFVATEKIYEVVKDFVGKVMIHCY
jgi:long-subunit acyl-CoA synthetase (AMP-forming)